ncbi:lymphotoxin-alpha [Ornithorhynchus anatinus]|uniref:lymphotoxin-alpha n=1 Tax=Ornithorhynchus anatinus TaxID=9258 RepID=UPI0019D4EE58|nr:lymphotoxin-alpha [Ornithorhynchus anatinus]
MPPSPPPCPWPPQALPMTPHRCRNRQPASLARALCLLGGLSLLLLRVQGHLGGPGVPRSPHLTAHLDLRRRLLRDAPKPAAHLIGDPSRPGSLLWRDNSDHAFLHHGFRLQNNTLLVPSSGVYFVYTQTVFSGPGCTEDGQGTLAPNYLSHEVLLFSTQYPIHVPLLSAQKSVCPGPKGPWIKSIYQGAVFSLMAGDQLSTRTEGVSNLLLVPGSVFFGAFAV